MARPCGTFGQRCQPPSGGKGADSGDPAPLDIGRSFRDDQYETIVSGDVDGDGVGEIVGRNAATVETWTWDRNYGTGDKFYDPVPGQWTQVIPKAATPSLPTEDGWWDPSRSSTFRLADIDGAGGDELIARTSEGLSIYRWDTTTTTWGAPITTQVFGDGEGFVQSKPSFYKTIMTGNVDGRPGDEILGRGPNGIETWTLDGNGLSPIGEALVMGEDYWNEEKYYLTIRVADVTGDSKGELLGRAADGMHVWTLDSDGLWNPLGDTLTWWKDDPNPPYGWDQPAAYKTISTGDVNGDGRADLLSRRPYGDGIDSWTFQDDHTWKRVAPIGGFTDAAGFGAEDAYETIQVADVIPSGAAEKPKDEMIGRNLNGVYHISLQDTSDNEYGTVWVLDQTGISQFSDANGWGSFTSPIPSDRPVPPDYRYSTIRPVTVETGKPQVVIGRDATGLRTLAFDDTGRTSLSPTFPGYADLTGFPNGLNTPADKLPATPEGRAYWYINAKAHRNYWPGAGDDATILQQYRNTDEIGNLESLNGVLGGGGFDPGQDSALNVSRPIYDIVNQDVNDWTTAVITLHDHLLGDQGLKQLIEQSFVTNAGKVDLIKESFETNPALVALLGDLLWGVIGLLAIAAPVFELGAIASAVVSRMAGLAGSGVAAGVGFLNPNAAVDTEGDKLKDEMVDSFCGAEAFVDQSFDQIVQDYGLLTSSARMVERSPAFAPLFDKAVRAMNHGLELWIWQQFANEQNGANFWVGWCDLGRGDCVWNNGDPGTWTSPEKSDISYRLVGESDEGAYADCSEGIMADASYSAFSELNPSLAASFSPRNTDTGKPRDARIGIEGWNLAQYDCTDQL